jgi:threonine/homoserine/homoserine lactone efflux protein
VTLALVALLAYALGFLAAIPIGATQVEIAKRAIAGRLDTALMVVLGSVLSDVMYGAIALFGLARFLSNRRVVAGFGLLGGLALGALAWLTMRQVAQARPLEDGSPAVRSQSRSFGVGIALAVTNAPIMFWWLLGVHAATQLGLVTTFTPRLAAAFVFMGGLGIGSYLTLLALIVRRVKHLLSPASERRLHLVMGVLLVVLAVYMVGSAVRTLRG